MGVGIFVVVPARQVAKLPVESLAARVVFAGMAPAVAAPIAERFDENLRSGLVGEHCPALAHRYMVCGIKAESCDVAESAHLASFPGGAKRITAILDQPEIVLFHKRGDGIEVENITQRVSDDDSHGLLAAGRFELVGVDLIGGQLDIDEDGYKTVLKNRVDC